MNSLKKQSGLSLIEILVALVISLFLLGGIAQVYLGNRATYSFTDAISRIQENGRFALEAITSDVRMAGFMGCVPIQPDRNNDGKLSDDNELIIQNHLNPANYTSGNYDFLDTPAITATDGVSDTLTIKGAKPGQSFLTEELAYPGSGPIVVDTSVSFKANDIVLITNCFTANIFQIDSATEDKDAGTISLTHTTAGSSPGNININKCSGGGHCLFHKTEKFFPANNAAAFNMQVVNYYIETPDPGEPVLHRVVNRKDEPLIEGIEKMQLKFGIDTDGDGFANQYLDTTDVADMREVKAVRIALVVRSDRTGMTESDQTYQIFGTDETANDSRLRQVFTSTIALRN